MDMKKRRPVISGGSDTRKLWSRITSCVRVRVRVRLRVRVRMRVRSSAHERLFLYGRTRSHVCMRVRHVRTHARTHARTRARAHTHGHDLKLMQAVQTRR